MAWGSKLFLFIVLSVLLIHCQSPSGKIIEDFKTVDESLPEISSVSHFAVDDLYKSIRKNRQKNESLAVHADKLFSSTKDAHAYLDNLKQRLEAADSSGLSKDLPGQLFVGTATADTLFQKLQAVHDHSYTALIDQNKARSLDSILTAFKEIRNNKQWTSKYFDKTPTIAAITILNKFQYDCLDAARIALGDINQHLDN